MTGWGPDAWGDVEWGSLVEPGWGTEEWSLAPWGSVAEGWGAEAWGDTEWDSVLPSGAHGFARQPMAEPEPFEISVLFLAKPPQIVAKARVQPSPLFTDDDVVLASLT